MKTRHLSFLFFVSFLLFVLGLSSCQKSNVQPYVRDDSLCVVLIEDEHFMTISNDTTEKINENPSIAYVKKAKYNQVSFTLMVKDNYIPTSCSYQRYRFSKVEDNLFIVSLFRIDHSMRVSLSFEYVEPSDDPDTPPISGNTITYDPNGGELISRRNNVIAYTTEHHPRPNTSIGTNIMKREGYNLIGWNTNSDGSGEHIGLGSRYLDVDNPSFTLYAEWVKYSDASNFTYVVNNETKGYLTITKYLGNEEVVSIPELIDGKTVTRIEKDAFVNVNAETIILPKSIVGINKGAFNNCSFKELYLYDNIVRINDECFVNCLNFSTVHINAIEGARFVTADRHATYADKVDRLILNKDTQKIIILGGSGAYYNVDACLLHKYYSNYEVFNLALNGWFNGPMQMEIIIPFMGPNDYLLHCVEMCGKYQFMTDISMGDFDEVSDYDYRYFCCLEQNFDLISLADIRHVTHFFDTFTSFNTARDKLPTVPYTAYTEYADERGDYMPNDQRTKIVPEDGSRVISEEGTIDPTSLSEEGANRLVAYYQELESKGVSVLFAYCPVNRDSLSEADLQESNILEFNSRVENYIVPYYVRVINSISDVLLDFEWFCDSDWHLDYEHALIFTNTLIYQIGAL